MEAELALEQVHLALARICEVEPHERALALPQLRDCVHAARRQAVQPALRVPDETGGNGHGCIRHRAASVAPRVVGQAIGYPRNRAAAARRGGLQQRREGEDDDGPIGPTHRAWPGGPWRGGRGRRMERGGSPAGTRLGLGPRQLLRARRDLVRQRDRLRARDR